MLSYSEQHDHDLIAAAAHDPRTGFIALWAIAAIFLVPGWLDREPVLVVAGALLGCAAAFATGRSVAIPRPSSRAWIDQRAVVRPATRTGSGSRRLRPEPARCRAAVTRRQQPCRRVT
jgi:hypothetical protein